MTPPPFDPRPGPALPQDAALPQLATALDPQAMAAVWARSLPPGVQLLGCTVERIKYRPRRNLSVAYRLRLRCGMRQLEQPVAARFTSAADAVRRHQAAQARGGRTQPAGLVCSHDPALHLVAHWWPNDPKLATAAALLADPDALLARCGPAVAAALAGAAGPADAAGGTTACWPGRPDQPDQPDQPDGPARPVAGAPRAEVQLAQLVPEQRVTARVRLPGTAPALIAKASADGRGAETQAVMAALWHSPARRSGRLRLPRPLLWQPDTGLHWQCLLPGEALLAVLARADASGDQWLPSRLQAQVGAQLAALHATPVPVRREARPAELAERLAALDDALAFTAPAWHARFGGLLAHLAEGLPSWLQAQPDVTLHGDLHPRNILCEAGQTALIDFDSVRRGPALLDLGSWLADGLFRQLLAGRPVAEAGAGLAGFLASYAQAARAAGLQPPDDAQVIRLAAWQLVTERAWRCLVNLKPGRFARVPEVLALAERLLSTGRLPGPTDAEAAP